MIGTNVERPRSMSSLQDLLESSSRRSPAGDSDDEGSIRSLEISSTEPSGNIKKTVVIIDSSVDKAGKRQSLLSSVPLVRAASFFLFGGSTKGGEAEEIEVREGEDESAPTEESRATWGTDEAEEATEPPVLTIDTASASIESRNPPEVRRLSAKRPEERNELVGVGRAVEKAAVGSKRYSDDDDDNNKDGEYDDNHMRTSPVACLTEELKAAGYVAESGNESAVKRLSGKLSKKLGKQGAAQADVEEDTADADVDGDGEEKDIKNSAKLSPFALLRNISSTREKRSGGPENAAADAEGDEDNEEDFEDKVKVSSPLALLRNISSTRGKRSGDEENTAVDAERDEGIEEEFEDKVKVSSPLALLRNLSSTRGKRSGDEENAAVDAERDEGSEEEFEDKVKVSSPLALLHNVSSSLRGKRSMSSPEMEEFKHREARIEAIKAQIKELNAVGDECEDRDVRIEELATQIHELKSTQDVDVEEAFDISIAERKRSNDPSTVRQRTDYPPGLFTNERGNLKAVSFVVRRPCLIFWFLIVLLIVISVLLGLLVFSQGNPFTPPTNEFDLEDERSVQYDSLRLARDEVAASRKIADTGSVVVNRQSEPIDIQYWVFEAETPQGVFGSEESIRAMKNAYDIFMEDPAYQDFCLLDYSKSGVAEEDRECHRPLTPLSMYYASEWDSDAAAAVIEEFKDPAKVDLFNELGLCWVRGSYCELVANAPKENSTWAMKVGMNIGLLTEKWDMKGDLVENFTQVTELASYLIKIDVFKGFVDFGMDKEFSSENLVSMYSRGIIGWGGPLNTRNKTIGTEEIDEESSDEEDKKDGDMLKAQVIDNWLDDMNAQSEPDRDASINSYYFMTAIIGDVILDIVRTDALLAIFSFVFIFFWLRVNTASWFLAWVGLMQIFFAIPVSWFIFSVLFQIKYFGTLNALALFIVAAIGADDIFIFIDAYKQSRYHPEVLVDLETRMSWVYRRTGTAMAITSATTCAAFLCTLITPLPSIQSFGIFAAVVIFIDYALVMSLFCTAVVIYHNRYEGNAPFGCCCPCGPVTPSNTEKALTSLEGLGGVVKRDKVSEFFRTKVAGFVKVSLHRAVLGLMFAFWVGLAIGAATRLEATKENEQFLNENHPLQKAFSILGTQFPTADDDLGLKVYYAWGVEEVDRTGVNRLINPEFYGSPQFLSGFDFNEQCQTELMAFCDKLKTDPQYSYLIKRKNGVGLVRCFIEELAAYNVKPDYFDDCDYVKKQEWKKANVTWQVNVNDIPTIIPEFLKQKTCFDPLGTETISGWYQNEIGWDGLAMRYAAVSAESSTLNPFAQDSESRTRNEYDQFVDIAKEHDKIISESCGGSVVMTDLREKFVFMNNQSIYIRTAIQSAILGVAIAFVVLLLSTWVFHLAFFASISIMCVLVSVVGTMVLLGWTLGSVESILIGIIAGFSVDYVVHLAHAYEIAKGDTYTRVTEAFGDLGISVFNGMITSVVASIPLFFCQLQFFAKFGTFLCLTIAFSWIFANFGFMSILAQLKIPLKDKGCRL